MPLLIDDFSWKETAQHVYIDVPLKGVKPSQVDVFTTNVYIKISYPPYLFETRLLDAVNEDKSSVTLSSGVAKIVLEKSESNLWKTLHHPESKNKEWMREERRLALEHVHRKAQSNQQEMAVKRREAERFGLQKQMKQEEEAKEAIQTAKQRVRDETVAEIEEWKAKEEVAGRILDQMEEENEISKPKPRILTAKELIAKSKTASKSVSTALPPTRQSGRIEVSFTPRILPTPMRESKIAEEEEWLGKMAQAGRAGTETTAQDKDKDMTERNPLWLRDRGNEFYQAGDYLSAVNAYTEAIEIDSTLPSLFSNRAACYLHLKRYEDCVEDCTQALSRLTPPIEANSVSRCRAHVRRAAAWTKLGNHEEALRDYQEARKLDPRNEQLRRDVERVEKRLSSA